MSLSLEPTTSAAGPAGSAREPRPRSKAPSPTPLATRLVLVATVAVTALALALFQARQGRADPRAGAPYLILFSGLFLLRVAGQLLVRTTQPRWLPPTEEWNLSPYALLLPSQLVMLGLMVWIDADFARASGFWVRARPAFGEALLGFAALYAGAMVVRYAVRMARRPEQRWFGGAIPIVFHWVLAGYLFVLGSFHAAH